MRAAFSIWEHRIAPVFDTSDRICLIDFQSGEISDRRQLLLPNEPAIAKITRLADSHVDVLICGAISGVINGIIESYGIQVIPFVSGDLEELTEHLISGETDWSRYAMPGCTAGKMRRRRKRQHQGKGSESPRTRP